MVFYNSLCFLLIFHFCKKTLWIKILSIYHLNTREKWFIFSKAKMLICILDCHNVELNTGTLPDLRWSSFRQQLTVGSQYLSSQGISSKMWQGSWICLSSDKTYITTVLLLLFSTITTTLYYLIIYSNKRANLESKSDLQ